MFWHSSSFKQHNGPSNESVLPVKVIQARQEILLLHFVNEGKHLLSCARSGLITLWDPKTGSVLCQVQDIGKINMPAVSSLPVVLATGGWDGRVSLWKIIGNNITRVGQLDKVEGALAFFPNGSRLVHGHQSRLEIVDIGADVKSLFQDLDSFQVGPIACSPDGHTIVASNHESSILIWDLQQKKQIAMFQGHSTDASRGVICVDFVPDGGSFATGGYDRLVKLWETRTGNLIKEFVGHRDPVISLTFSYDGKMLATTTGVSFDVPGELKIWDIIQGNELVAFHAHRKAVLCSAFSPDGKSLATGGLDGDLKIWDLSELAK